MLASNSLKPLLRITSVARLRWAASTSQPSVKVNCPDCTLGPRFAHDLQAAALRAADADDAHGEAIVGGCLLGRAFLLGGQELPGIPGRQPAAASAARDRSHETSSR